jgi:hypothetical protein
MNRLFYKRTVGLTSDKLNHTECHPDQSPSFLAEREQQQG